MQLFYHSELTKHTKQFSFDKIESRHLVRVLRKTEGDTIFITNGLGQLFTSIITVANDKKFMGRISTVESKKKHWKKK